MNLPITKRQQDIIIANIRKNGLDRNIVELGCGDGHNLESFARAGLRGEGYDISKEALEAAKKRSMGSFKVREGNLLDLKIRGRSTILLLLTLEHLKDDITAVRKIRTYLKEGGWFILSVPAHKRKYANQDKLAGHYRRYDRRGIVDLLARNGFSIKEIYCMGFPLGNFSTAVFNLWAKLQKTGETLVAHNTRMTGIEEHSGYYPRGLRQISRVALPILAMLRSLDAPFLNSDLGTHYLVFSQKESAESSSSGAIPRKGPNLKTPARFFPPRMKCR